MKDIKYLIQKFLIIVGLLLISSLIGIFNNKVIGYTQENPAPSLSKNGIIAPNGEYSIIQEDLWKNKYLFCIQPDTKLPSGKEWGYRVVNSNDVIYWNTETMTVINNKKNLNIDNDKIWKLGYFIASEANEGELREYDHWDQYKKESTIQNEIWEIINGKNYYEGYTGLEFIYSFTWPVVTKTQEKVDTTIKTRKTIKETNGKNTKMVSLESAGIDLKNIIGLTYDEKISNADYYAVGPYKISKSIRRCTI
ncbi:MAG: hypothetical protein ACI4UX_04990 [Clostridia bacterium]